MPNTHSSTSARCAFWWSRTFSLCIMVLGLQQRQHYEVHPAIETERG